MSLVELGNIVILTNHAQTFPQTVLMFPTFKILALR